MIYVLIMLLGFPQNLSGIGLERVVDAKIFFKDSYMYLIRLSSLGLMISHYSSRGYFFEFLYKTVSILQIRKTGWKQKITIQF